MPSLLVGSRVGTFTVKQGGQEVRYKVTQCDLPCVVETHKTEDNKLYYKIGDIGILTSFVLVLTTRPSAIGWRRKA